MSRYLLIKKIEEIYPGDGDEPVEGREIKFVIFDERFLLNIPPAFPNTGKFEVMSWYE